MLAVLLLALAAGAPAVADEPAAAAELQSIREHFPERPRAQSIAALDALAARHPEAPSGARALLWLGDLALRDRLPDEAERRYTEARRRFPTGEIAALGARGLGDAAARRGRWALAAERYQLALDGASPVLALELRQKRAAAITSQHRFFVELSAWFVALGVLAVFARRLFAARRALRLPIETLYLLPVHALLIAACWRRDPGVLRALEWLAGGTLLLVTAAFAAPHSARPARRLALDGALLVVATAAVFYIALRRGGIIDPLIMTLTSGADL